MSLRALSFMLVAACVLSLACALARPNLYEDRGEEKNAILQYLLRHYIEGIATYYVCIIQLILTSDSES